MRDETEYMGALVDASIAQIHDLSSRLSALVEKDNEIRAAGAPGKFSHRTLSKVYNLLSVPLKDQKGIQAVLSAISSHSTIEESSAVAPRTSNGAPDTIVPAPSICKRPSDADELADWLAVEMPAGTVIGNPRWWARHIARHINRRSE